MSIVVLLPITLVVQVEHSNEYIDYACTVTLERTTCEAVAYYAQSRPSLLCLGHGSKVKVIGQV